MPRQASTLLEWKESAYGTHLFVDGEMVLLLTQVGAIRLAEGRPAEKMTVPFGPTPALRGDSIVYWNEGKVSAVFEQGSEPRTLGTLERPPQRLLASDERVAWLTRGDDGSFALQTLDGGVPRPVYHTNDAIVTATLAGDRVYFVERTGSSSWRIGAVPFSGKPPFFSRAYRGRTPSMLAASAGRLYFYDGPTRSVRRLNADLEQETVLARDVICSPLTVSNRVLCAHLGGVFDIPGPGRAPRLLATESGGPIAVIAADDKRVAWVTDTAEGELAVRSVALPPLR